MRMFAPGHRLAELRAWAAERGIPGGASLGDDSGEAGDGGAPRLFDPRVPRGYQRDAVNCWLAAGGRGSIVLPTGAGKSFVAILAVYSTGARACVVAPTRALVAQ